MMACDYNGYIDVCSFTSICAVVANDIGKTNGDRKFLLGTNGFLIVIVY